MARVHNWQIGREMATRMSRSGPSGSSRRLRHQQVHRLPDLHARLQDDVDLRQGPGVHAVEQRRVEAVRLLSAGVGREALDKLGAAGPWSGGPYEGRTLFEAAQAGERVLGWRPEDSTTPTPTSARTTVRG